MQKGLCKECDYTRDTLFMPVILMILMICGKIQIMMRLTPHNNSAVAMNRRHYTMSFSVIPKGPQCCDCFGLAVLVLVIDLNRVQCPVN